MTLHPHIAYLLFKHKHFCNVDTTVCIDYKRDSSTNGGGSGGGGGGCASPVSTSSGWSGDITVYQQQQRRGSLQLWQFLVALLDDPSNASCIVWTGRGMEFKLVEPEEVSTNRWK